jgi:hypothetical protein
MSRPAQNCRRKADVVELYEHAGGRGSFGGGAQSCFGEWAHFHQRTPHLTAVRDRRRIVGYAPSGEVLERNVDLCLAINDCM